MARADCKSIVRSKYRSSRLAYAASEAQLKEDSDQQISVCGSKPESGPYCLILLLRPELKQLPYYERFRIEMVMVLVETRDIAPPASPDGRTVARAVKCLTSRRIAIGSIGHPIS